MKKFLFLAVLVAFCFFGGGCSGSENGSEKRNDTIPSNDASLLVGFWIKTSDEAEYFQHFRDDGICEYGGFDWVKDTIWFGTYTYELDGEFLITDGEQSGTIIINKDKLYLGGSALYFKSIYPPDWYDETYFNTLI
jgi:hypothetical protein